MDNQTILENTVPELFTLSYADQVLGSNSDQLSDCTNIILESNNCHLSPISPLNDSLLEETLTIETDDRAFFVDGEQLITFNRPTGLNKQQNNAHIILSNESEKPLEDQELSFTTNSDDFFPDINIDFSKIHSDNNIAKTIDDCDDLTERLDILSNINIDVTKSNYSNSTAIQILEDVGNSPIETNGHFVCDLCLHEFYNWQNYKKHKLEHLNDKPFKCLKCLKSFNYNNNYLLHIASHFPNNLKCPQCKKEFNRFASLKAHLRIHRTEESITCNICNSVFYNQHRLDIHKETCMQENNINSNTSLNKETPVTRYITCKICKQSLSNVSDYRKHVKEHKKFDLVLKRQYKFAMRVKKMVKKRNSVKRFKCDHCDWSFNKSILLRRHMRTHTGEKPFECPRCSKHFTQENSLNRHLLEHTGLRPFKCEFCKMSFSQKGHLINHIKKCHAVAKEVTRIHKCTMCSCVYNSLNALNKHLNIYHGVKTKKSNKNVQNNVPKCIENVETDYNDEPIDLSKGKIQFKKSNKNVQNNVPKCIENVETDYNDEPINLSKDTTILEKWFDEVAQELQIGNDNNTELMECDDQISVPSDFGLNLIETEDYDDIERDFNLSNSKNNIETDNVIYISQNGIIYIVPKKKLEQAVPTKYHTVVKNQGKESAINSILNESIPLSLEEITKNLVVNVSDSISPSVNEIAKNVTLNDHFNESIPFSMKETNKHLVINEKIPLNMKETTKNLVININDSISSNVNETARNVTLNNNFNETIPSSVVEITKNIELNNSVNKSIPSSVEEIIKQIAINDNVNESISSRVRKTINKKVLINTSRNELLPSTSIQGTKKVSPKQTKNTSRNELIPSTSIQETKLVSPRQKKSANEISKSSCARKTINKKVLITTSTNELIPSTSIQETKLVSPKQTKNTSTNELIPSTSIHETKKVSSRQKKNTSRNELIPSTNIQETKKVSSRQKKNTSRNELIPSTSIQETKMVSPRQKKSANKISKSDTNTKLSEKNKVKMLNSKENSIITTYNTSNKIEPKVSYLPNISTNVEPKITKIIPKREPKVCQYCSKMFKKNADLERHKRIHTGDKPYKCDVDGCNKAFTTKSSFNYHAITHLGQMKRAVCPVCNGLFATSSTMKVHMRQHTGEKPYKCPVCGDAFRTTGHLHTHVIIHERKTKRK